MSLIIMSKAKDIAHQIIAGAVVLNYITLIPILLILRSGRVYHKNLFLKHLCFNMTHDLCLFRLQPHRKGQFFQLATLAIVVEDVLHDLVTEFVAVVDAALVLLGDEGHLQILHYLLLFILQLIEVDEQDLELEEGGADEQVEEQNQNENHQALNYYVLAVLVQVYPNCHFFAMAEEDVVTKWRHYADD